MIRIVIPFYQEFETLKPALRQLRDHNFQFETMPVMSPLIANARNHGVTASTLIRQNPCPQCSHVLFVDSDICFSYDDLLAAIDHDREILALPYLNHAPDPAYEAALFVKRGKLGTRFVPETKGLHKVDFVGAGFLLVRQNVFQHLRYPYFRYDAFEENGFAENIGEDVGFCMNAKEAGIPIYCDFDRPVYHRRRKREQFDVSY